jgi:Cytosol aminopeptidase family, N-terminal domain
MDLGFLTPDAEALDEAKVELCACSIWSDQRPMGGLAGLLDWWLGGRLSALLKSGFVKGETGEALLVPGKPHVPFEKVLVLGLGARAEFDDARFLEAMGRVARSLERLRVRRCVIELPGRGSDAIEPERAMTLTLEGVGASPQHDAWWVVEPLAAQKRMQTAVDEERRRSRAI